MKRSQIMIGIALIVFGLISLINVLFPGIHIGRFIIPLFLIGLGLLLILHPWVVGPGVKVQTPFLGDLWRGSVWEVTRHEIWWFVGSNRLDFTQAVFPEGDGEIKILGFVNDITIILPEDVGLMVDSTAFLNDYHGLTDKQERFFSNLHDETANYSKVEKRVHLRSIAFVAEIRIRKGF